MTEQWKTACSRCGAPLDAAGQQSLKCDFCGETTDILKEETELPVIDEIKSIVPFTVDKNSLVSVTQNYMISGALTPDDLLENSVITKQSLYYVPTYLFSGNYEANWTASFGYYRKEQDNDNKTKIVTDWRPVSGIDNGNFQVPVYAGSMLPGNVSELIQADDLNKKLTPFKQEFLIGCDVELFSIKEKDAYENCAKPIIDKIIDAGVKEHKQGYIQQNWQWTVKFDKEITDTVLMPIAHSIFEYKGKEYHVWVDGSGSSKMIADEPPKDNSRQNAFALGYIPILISLIGLLLAYVFFGSSAFTWKAVLSSLSFSVLYVLKRDTDIINYSKTIKNYLLLQKQSASVNTQGMSDEDKAKLVNSYTKPKIPFFADLRKDIILLPLVSVISTLIMLIPILIILADL